MIQAYIKNKAIRRNTLFKIENGEGFYEVQGVRFTRSQFYQMFPLNLNNRNNPNKKDEWLKDKKSY